MSFMTETRERAGAAGEKSPQAAPAPTYEGDFVLDEPLLLDCGRVLVRPTLHYAVYGKLDAARDNVVLVCHALSGSAQVGSWWPELFAPGATLSLDRDCVICINLLGSCYGSTGPGSVNPETGSAYGPDFPLVSIRDNVRAQSRLIASLGIPKLRLVLGGSIGGMQALEWAILEPGRVERAAIIGVAPLSAMGIALNHLQRSAIQKDPEWAGGYYLPQRQPRTGLGSGAPDCHVELQVAGPVRRAIWTKPNRNGEDPHGLDDQGGGLVAGRFDIAGYLDYQGETVCRSFRCELISCHLAHHGDLGSDAWPRHAARGIWRHSRAAKLCGYKFGLAVSA